MKRQCIECKVETEDYFECGSCHNHVCETCYFHEKECWEADEDSYPVFRISDHLSPEDLKYKQWS